jgi:signal transduction histidine kinase
VHLKNNRQVIADWLQRNISGAPAQNKPRALVIILAAMIMIGISDYVTGIQVSLLLFYFIPVMLSVAWLGWRVAVMVAVGSVVLRMIGDFVANEGDILPIWNLWNALTALPVFLILIWILDAFFSLNRQLEQRVKDRTAALVDAARTRRQLEGELLAVGSRERNVIGHELHDEICQHLVGTALAAQVLVQQLNEKNSSLATNAETIVALLEEGADKTRKLAHGLLLSEIEPEKLGEKLSEIADQANGAGILCRFIQEGDTLVRDAGTAAHLFRIAHEALRNALKHAAPHRINISLIGSTSAIDLIVEDDGTGIATDSLANNGKNAGMGLRIMSNRAAFIGASLTINQASGYRSRSGTSVICKLPRVQEST